MTIFTIDLMCRFSRIQHQLLFRNKNLASSGLQKRVFSRFAARRRGTSKTRFSFKLKKINVFTAKNSETKSLAEPPRQILRCPETRRIFARNTTDHFRLLNFPLETHEPFPWFAIF